MTFGKSHKTLVYAGVKSCWGQYFNVSSNQQQVCDPCFQLGWPEDLIVWILMLLYWGKPKSCVWPGCWISHGPEQSYWPSFQCFLLLSADEDGAAHPQEAPRVCPAPKCSPCTTGDGRHQFHAGCSHHWQHNRRNCCGRGWRHTRAMQGNTQNRSLLVLVTLVYLADITLKFVLGHYLRSLLVLNLCGPVLHCQELFISFWSFKDFLLSPNPFPSFIQTYWLHIMNSGMHISWIFTGNFLLKWAMPLLASRGQV